MAADRTLGKEGVLARQLELDQHTDRRPDDQRRNGGQHGEARDRHGHAAEPADQPDENPDDRDQDGKTEDGSGQQVAAQEGEHVNGDADRGQQAQGPHRLRVARDGALLAKQPEADCDHPKRDPAERAGMHVCEQDLPWQGDEVKPVEDADRDRDRKDQETGLKQPANLAGMAATNQEVPLFHSPLR